MHANAWRTCILVPHGAKVGQVLGLPVGCLLEGQAIAFFRSRKTTNETKEEQDIDIT